MEGTSWKKKGGGGLRSKIKTILKSSYQSSINMLTSEGKVTKSRLSYPPRKALPVSWTIHNSVYKSGLVDTHVFVLLNHNKVQLNIVFFFKAISNN